MIPYFFAFFFLVSLFLLEQVTRTHRLKSPSLAGQSAYLDRAGHSGFGHLGQPGGLSWLQWIAFVFLSGLIGLRHEVGGDWEPYLNHFERHAGDLDSGATIEFDSEIGYQLLNFMAYWMGGDIHLVNLMAAVISLGCLIAAFRRWESDVLFGLICSFPYLILVMLMGYTRQGLAACIALYALSFVRHGQTGKYVLGLIVSMQFHMSAILLLTLLYSQHKLEGRTLLKFVGLCLFVTILYLALYQQVFNPISMLEESSYTQNYLLNESMISSGLFQRILLIALNFSVFFIFYQLFSRRFNDIGIFWSIFLLYAALMLASMMGMPSTPVDRFMLYAFVFSIVIPARVPVLLSSRGFTRQVALLTLCLISFAQLYGWLHYAYNAFAWVPYENWLFL